MANPVKFSLELRDQNGVLVDILNKYWTSVSWEYDRVGGCGRASVDLAVPYDFLDKIGPDYDVQIWVEDETGLADLFYRGYVESHQPVLQETDKVSLSLSGYVGQLKRVRVAHTYTNMEVSAVIKDVLDSYVLPGTDITYDATDIEFSGFNIDTLEFDGMADDALTTLAELAGTFEWGVDRNRKFFCKRSTDAIRHYTRIGKDQGTFDSLDDYSLIYNKLYLKGGKVDDVTFEDTVNNTESQTSYGIRSKIISNSAIVTSAVAQQYGTSVLTKEARIQRRVSITVPVNLKMYEKTTPLGALSVLSTPVPVAKKYGDTDAIYGAFKYGGIPSFQIDKLRYELQSEGMKLSITAGTARPNLYKLIKRLQYEIDQLRSG